MNRAPVLLLALLALPAGVLRAVEAPPVPAHPRDLRYGELRFAVPDPARYRHELAGGVVAFVAEDHALPLVKVSLTLRGGSYLDPEGKTGLASLTAAMLRRGGAGTLSAEAFDERADFLATSLSSEAGPTATTFTLNCLSQRLDESLDLLFAMLTAPRFDEARLAVEKSSRHEALAQRNDDAGDILDREWAWLLYGPRHVAAREASAAELASIGRDDLAAFHARTYGPRHLVVAVAGDVETAAILGKLKSRLAAWKSTAADPAWPPVFPEHTPRPGLYHVEKDIPQGKVELGHLGVRWERWDDPEMAALQVMNEILGGDFTSRITQRVRSDEGLAYSAGSDYEIGVHWPGSFAVAFESKSATVALAAKISLEEIRRIQREPVSDGELRQAKAAFVDSFPRRFETPFQIVRTYASDVTLGRPHAYWQDYRDRMRAVDAAQVRAVAGKYLRPDAMLLLVVGRWSEIAPGDADGRARMGELFGGEATHLPLRDPLTLEPRP